MPKHIDGGEEEGKSRPPQINFYATNIEFF